MRKIDLSSLKNKPPGTFHPYNKPTVLGNLTAPGGVKTWKIEKRVARAFYPIVKKGLFIDWDVLRVLVTVPIFNSDILLERMYKILFLRDWEKEDEREERRKKAVYHHVKGIIYKSFGFIGQEICLAMLQNQGEKELKGAYGIQKTPDLESKNFVFEVKTTEGKRITFRKFQLKKNLAYAKEKGKRLKILILLLSGYQNQPLSFIVKDIFYAPSGSFLLNNPKHKRSKTISYSIPDLKSLGSSFWRNPIENLKK